MCSRGCPLALPDLYVHGIRQSRCESTGPTSLLLPSAATDDRGLPVRRPERCDERGSSGSLCCLPIATWRTSKPTDPDYRGSSVEAQEDLRRDCGIPSGIFDGFVVPAGEPRRSLSGAKEGLAAIRDSIGIACWVNLARFRSYARSWPISPTRSSYALPFPDGDCHPLTATTRSRGGRIPVLRNI